MMPTGDRSMSPVAFARTVWRLYAEERPLLWTAMGGLALAGASGARAILGGGWIVPPEGQLFKAASFDAAVAIYLLTVALMVPLAGFSARGRKVWRWILVLMVWFGYGVETVQIWRGLDPRFSRFGGNADGIAGGLFLLSALIIFVTFLVLAARFFLRRSPGAGRALVLALRYASLAAVLSFSIGIAMSFGGGPRVSPGGNLLPLHAAGFHGLQAVPLVALLLLWSRVSARIAERTVHLAGLAWLAACGAIAWQSFGGRSVLEVSPATLVAAVALAWWGILLGRAAFAFRREGRWPEVLTAS
jgi:hypothetical protein